MPYTADKKPDEEPYKETDKEPDEEPHLHRTESIRLNLRGNLRLRTGRAYYV